VMLSVLRAGTCDEVIQSAHLRFHVLHLLVHNTDRFGVDGFSSLLEGYVVLVCSL
jgi:hypothetical protein